MRILLLLALLISPLAQADNLLDRLPQLGGGQPTFLPPDEAFGFEASVKDDHTIQGNFRVTPTYYLYRDKIHVTVKKGKVKIKEVKLPKGDMKDDPNFGQMYVFHHSFQAEVILENTSGSAQTVTLEAGYQGCSENGLCYPPQTREVTLKLPAPPKPGAGTKALQTPEVTSTPLEAAPAPKAEVTAPIASTTAASTTAPAAETESSKIAQVFKQKSFWLVVSFFFGAGLLWPSPPACSR